MFATVASMIIRFETPEARSPLNAACGSREHPLDKRLMIRLQQYVGSDTSSCVLIVQTAGSTSRASNPSRSRFGVSESLFAQHLHALRRSRDKDSSYSFRVPLTRQSELSIHSH